MTTSPKARALKPYVHYLHNVGGDPLIKDFDVDWAPVGPLIREGLVEQGLALQDGAYIIPTCKGYELIGKPTPDFLK